jgi:hypothetical protein
MMALVAMTGLLSAALAYTYRSLNPPPPVPDFQLAALYLHDGKLRLSAAEEANDPEWAQRLLLGAEYNLLFAEIHAVRAELARKGFPVVQPRRKW